jgi:hypothetical protein
MRVEQSQFEQFTPTRPDLILAKQNLVDAKGLLKANISNFQSILLTRFVSLNQQKLSLYNWFDFKMNKNERMNLMQKCIFFFYFKLITII